ncbi:recombination protein Bet,phage recombination protein Bet,RecT family [[Clostridium] sordellii]|uniref:phage recombination protein Bet n=1 Tax=Paraclostridium sordellii TaxID=1505 RepID=UPI0005427E8A|nr:phage recombination protein Bet [Paeniclostridium sordellii]CEK35430.1 recombination protein Bet,phage recombination protein Bet,RecT family [[Clostridium] sordellii] [Paeniclostridium sordellii]
MNNIQSSALALAEFKLDGGQVLTADTVRNYLTSGNGKVSDQEVLMFIELCKSQRLNPFVRDAYLVKMGDAYPAQIIVGKDVFIKRASEHPNFNGMKAGIVVLDKKGDIKEREGALKLPGEELVGGWCEVHLKDKDFPVKSIVSFEEYAQKTKAGTLNSMWSTKGATMIRKVAQSQALREAFPNELRGLYQQEEMGVHNKLPEKEVKVGYATTAQKQGIMKLASLKGLYDYNNPKDISKMENFCESNGFNLKELKREEVDEVLDLLSNYEPKEKIIDADFREIEEIDTDKEVVQESLDV